MARTRQDALLGLVSQMSGGSRRGTTLSQYLKAIIKNDETHEIIIFDQNNNPTNFYSAIQPDYAQADEEALDFIKNKPNLTIYALQNDLLAETEARELADDNLATQISSCFTTLAQEGNRLTLTKYNGVEEHYEPTIPGAMIIKGHCLQSDLPTSEQQNGDYWVLDDTTGEYVGKSAIWSDSDWIYTGTTISVDQTVQEGSTNAVSGNGVYEHTRQLVQIIYNAIYPIRCRVIGFDAPSIPAGVEATWEIDEDYNGKYLYVDSGQTPGTIIEEGAVIGETVLTTEQIPSHNHNIQHNHGRGSMEIVGTFGNLYTGASPAADGAFSSTQKGDSVSYSKSGTANSWRKYTFKASDKWTGVTSGPWNASGNPIINSGSTGGGEGHTHEIGHIKPAGVAVSVWKRTA